MRLRIQNFAKVKEADIILDGITIIAGKNNTGKSTIGKVLDSMYNSVNNLGAKMKNAKKLRLQNTVSQLMNYTEFSVHSPFLDNKVIKYLEEKLEEYHFDVDDMMQKIKNWEEGNVVYEGDTLHTYLLMDILGIHELCYIVTPEFSYKRSMAPHIALCPDCGSETVEKEEKTDDMKGCFNKGRFCKHCNKWTVCFLVNET